MILHLETISDSMRSIAKIIYDRLDSRYYLAGGTALALLIGHRTSIDLDYFIDGPIETEKLKQELMDCFIDSQLDIVFQEKNTLWVNINGVKVSFITRAWPLLEAVYDTSGFRCAQLKDLTLMKLSAICGREEYKDYFDLACLSTLTDVRSWVPWWQEVFPNVDPSSWIIALSAAHQVPPIPLDLQNDFRSIEPVKVLKNAELEIVKFIQAS